MNPIDSAMKAALAAATTNASLLDGFGLERISVAPPLWHEALTLDGRGNGAIRTVRSITDANGEAIGEFRSAVDPGQIARLLHVLHDTDFGALVPSHIEAMDMRIELSILIDGLRRDVGIALQRPERMEPVQPLLRELDRIAVAVRKTHVATLSLTVSVPDRLPLGDGPVRVSVSFKNAGVVGAWIKEPSALTAPLPGAAPIEAVDKPDYEKMSLFYWEVPVEDPNVAMLPATIEETPLSPVNPPPRPYLWLAAGATVTRDFVALPSLGVARPHYLRAGFSSYAGSDMLVGRKRLRGAAFSNLAKVDVG